jgi:hypothetical protein
MRWRRRGGVPALVLSWLFLPCELDGIGVIPGEGEGEGKGKGIIEWRLVTFRLLVVPVLDPDW